MSEGYEQETETTNRMDMWNPEKSVAVDHL